MIEIKTLDETRAGRVVVQITVGSEPVADVPPAGDDRALYGAAVDAERELVQAQQRIAELERTLAAARAAEDSRMRERDRKIRGLERSVEAFREGWNKTQAELVQLRASGTGGERIADLEAKLDLAQADRANLKHEVTRLEGELEAAHRLAQSADTRRATAELRAEQAAADLDAATGHLLLRDGELASANDQRDNWRAAAEQLKTELVSVKGERDAERSRADQNRAWAERVQAHVSRLDAELVTANDNFVTSQNRVAELEAANASLVAEARERQADPGTRLYTAAEVASAQTSEAELVTAPLKERIIELEAELEAAHTVVGSIKDTMVGLPVVAALDEVTPGTAGDVLARAVRLTRLTLGMKARG